MKIIQYSKNGGFTLAELTIVLVIVALLIGGLTVPLSVQIDQRDYNETRRQLEEIRESLIGFAVAHGRLPRPAVSFADGWENPNNCSDDSNCTGFIPWSTLGVKKTDAWGKMIRYSVTPAYAVKTGFTLTTKATKKIQTRNDDSTTPDYIVGSKSECNPCAPAVILSHGKRGAMFNGEKIVNDSETNIDEKANAEATKDTFIVRDPSNVSTASGGEFDDIVVWIPPYLLLNRMVAAGRLP